MHCYRIHLNRDHPEYPSNALETGHVFAVAETALQVAERFLEALEIVKIGKGFALAFAQCLSCDQVAIPGEEFCADCLPHQDHPDQN